MLDSRNWAALSEIAFKPHSDNLWK